MSSAVKLLLDENLSWRVARALKKAGFHVTTTQEAKLSALHDNEVFRYAQSHKLCLVTRDADFLTSYAPPHSGIIYVHCPEDANNATIIRCLLDRLPSVLATSIVDAVQQIHC
jgi:predicted nuclease of predicted toxin-antitoxin system